MKIIAHRAKGFGYKENTKEAIMKSLESKYTNGIEIDIRLTKDKKFIINHDPFYKGYLISNTKLKKLQKLGLSSLEEVIKTINSNKIILIEIKSEKDHKTIIKNLYPLLKKYQLNYYIQSFSYNLVKEFKKKHPNLKLGLIIGIEINHNKIKNNFDFNAINYRYADKCDNKETFVWTVNNKKELSKVQHNQNIVTDNSKYFYRLINE